jgi:1-deoxy-D-xylulose-5-phosphate reductoisomerase
MKNISILGSTGSIGTSTLKIIEKYPNKFKVIGITAGKNISLLLKQIEKFSPQVVAVMDKGMAQKLKKLIGKLKVSIYFGMEGFCKVATLPDVDMVMSAIIGSAGLIPTLEAIKAGKDIALANKETLVMAGPLIMKIVGEKKVRLFPVDSEHSAIFQSILGHKSNEVRKIILTASGGPFIHHSFKDLERVTPEEALAHPKWKMGGKISIDSATFMNKGLEIIEACFLFNLPPEKIEVCIHKEAIVHSMVEYHDGSVVAQLSLPDMKLPIAYALSFPERLDLGSSSLDLTKIGNLTFLKPDLKRYEALKLAYNAATVAGTMPTVLNASNEVAVEAFLERKIGFLEIIKLVKSVIDNHEVKKINCLEDVLEADRWARSFTYELISIKYPKLRSS